MAQQALFDELAIQKVRVERLLLDSENPRLVTQAVEPSQNELLENLYKYSLGELMESIAERGYFSEEPLIGVPSGQTTEDGEEIFTIVEGNRRLAALRLLLFEEDRKLVDAKNVPAVGITELDRIREVPVKVYRTRKEVVPYLGVRHIVGVKPWDALTKARYIRRLLVTENMTIDQVSRSVGHRGDTAYRWLLTLYVLEQANRTDDAQWEEASKSFNFSFLYTALGYRAVRDFLEIDNTQLRDPKEDPVPDKQHRRLLDHMSDLYGPAPGDPDRTKIRDSRTIRQLAAVYASDEAVESLRTGASLGEAYRRTAGEEMELIELLRDASVNLDRANGVAPHHKGQSQALRYAGRCKESAEALVGLLEG